MTLRSINAALLVACLAITGRALGTATLIQGSDRLTPIQREVERQIRLSTLLADVLQK